VVATCRSTIDSGVTFFNSGKLTKSVGIEQVLAYSDTALTWLCLVAVTPLPSSALFGLLPQQPMMTCSAARIGGFSLFFFYKDCPNKW
jgi:hypothetical protein